MKGQSIYLFVLFNAAVLVSSQEEYCYANDADKRQTKHFATKTPYEVAHGSEKRYFNVPKCEAVKFWLISRHGTRNPSAKSIEKLKDLTAVRDEVLENFKRFDRDRHLNQLCAEDLEQLKNWRIDYNLTAAYEYFLTVQGWNDLKYMAIDYQRTFQEVIETQYSREKFRFAFTNTQRTEASFKAFAEGLFGPNQPIDLQPEANNSILLQPYELCSKWAEQEDASTDKNSEYFKFQQSEIFKRTLQEISSRLGFKYTLNNKQVDTIFDMCRYDQAWYLQDDSPWCAAFTREHVDVLEYNADLKHFYKAGPGNELNQNVMCAAVQDMLKFLGSETDPKVVAYFTHASAIQLFLTSLYGQEDVKLRADNYKYMKNRKFRSSNWAPFASNVAVVKYFCPNEQNKYKVQFFLNEKPMDFPFCNIGLCDLDKVIENYRSFLDADCSEMFCGENSSKKLSFSLLTTVSLLILTIFTR